jgi:RNA polymerase sigma factor (sigma-70 family)
MTKEQELTEELRKGNKAALARVYSNYREEFILFASKYELAEDDILDVFQDSIIALYENAQKNKLDTIKSSLKTYLFAIGKYKIFKILKSNALSIETENFILIENLELYEPDMNDELSIKLQNAYQKLGKQCKEILRLSFYEGKSNEEILEELDYSTKDVVKSQKSRCIKQLKELISPNEKNK